MERIKICDETIFVMLKAETFPELKMLINM